MFVVLEDMRMVNSNSTTLLERWAEIVVSGRNERLRSDNTFERNGTAEMTIIVLVQSATTLAARLHASGFFPNLDVPTLHWIWTEERLSSWTTDTLGHCFRLLLTPAADRSINVVW